MFLINIFSLILPVVYNKHLISHNIPHTYYIPISFSSYFLTSLLPSLLFFSHSHFPISLLPHLPTLLTSSLPHLYHLTLLLPLSSSLQPFYPLSPSLLLFSSFTLLLFYSFTLLLFYSFTLFLFYSFPLLLFSSFHLLLFYSFTPFLSYSFPLLLYYSLPLILSFLVLVGYFFPSLANKCSKYRFRYQLVLHGNFYSPNLLEEAGWPFLSL